MITGEQILENIETICADIHDVDEMALALEQIGIASSNMIHELVETVEFYRKQVDKSVIEIQSLLSIIKKALEILKQCNVDMDSLWLCENIDHAIYTLKGEDNNGQRRK